MTIAIDNTADLRVQLQTIDRELLERDREIEAVEDEIKGVDEEAEVYLRDRAQAELNRIAHARAELDPADAARNTIAFGQYVGVKALRDYPELLRQKCNTLLVDREDARSQRQELQMQLEQTNA